MIVSFLETADHDFDLENGNLVLCRDARAIAAHIETRFRFFLGEWFLDLREGVPYYEDILVKNPDIGVLRQILRYVVVSTPGVVDIQTFSLEYEASSRTVRYAFNATADSGEEIEGGNAFIVLKKD